MVAAWKGGVTGGGPRGPGGLSLRSDAHKARRRLGGHRSDARLFVVARAVDTQRRLRVGHHHADEHIISTLVDTFGEDKVKKYADEAKANSSSLLSKMPQSARGAHLKAAN